MALDVISFVIRCAAFGNIRNRRIGQTVSAMKMAGSGGSQRKRQTIERRSVAQALIGHDSKAMHELYVSVGREALEKAAAALPEI